MGKASWLDPDSKGQSLKSESSSSRCSGTAKTHTSRARAVLTHGEPEKLDHVANFEALVALFYKLWKHLLQQAAGNKTSTFASQVVSQVVATFILLYIHRF